MNKPVTRSFVLLPVVMSVVLLLLFGSGAAEKITVIRNVTLVPMTDSRTVPDQAVVIEAGKISKVGPAAEIAVPEGAEVVDGRGAYLMPGLADMHVHYTSAFPNPPYDLFLANGVTTVRDLAQGVPASILSFGREIESGKRLGPSLLVATTVWGWEDRIVDFVAAQRPLGFVALKINSYLSPSDFEAVMRKTKETGWYTLGHIPYLVGLDGVIAGGMREISHVDEILISDMLDIDRSKAATTDAYEEMLLEALHRECQPWLDASPEAIREAYRARAAAIAARVKAGDITVTTTMMVEGDIALKMNHPEVLRSAPHAPYIQPAFWKDLEAGKDKHQQFFPKGQERAWIWAFEVEKVLCEELKKAGVRLVAGTDVGPTYMSFVPGFSLLNELALLAECGFSPYEAIASATRVASDVAAEMTGRNEFGTIEAGKRADFILVRKNPLESIENLRQPLGVMAAGRWLPRAELDKLLAVKVESIKDSLLQAYEKGGAEAVLEKYRFYTDNNLTNVYQYNEYTLDGAAAVLLGQRHVEDALELFQASTEYYPGAWSVFVNLGAACLGEGKTDLALEAFERALVLDPSQVEVRKALAELKVKAGEKQ